MCARAVYLASCVLPEDGTSNARTYFIIATSVYPIRYRFKIQPAIGATTSTCTFLIACDKKNEIAAKIVSVKRSLLGHKAHAAIEYKGILIEILGTCLKLTVTLKMHWYISI